MINLLQCENECDDYSIEYQQHTAIDNLFGSVAHLPGVSEKTSNPQSICGGSDRKVVGELESRANKAQVNPDDCSDRSAQTLRYKRTGRSSTHNTDSRRCGHIRAHQDTGQNQQPE